jgi:hypothetical protein
MWSNDYTSVNLNTLINALTYDVCVRTAVMCMRSGGNPPRIYNDMYVYI